MSQATSQPNIIIASNRNIRSIHSADDCRQWQSFPPSISAKSSSSYLRAISEYDRAMLRNDDPVAFNEEDRHLQVRRFLRLVCLRASCSLALVDLEIHSKSVSHGGTIYQ